jgi:ornithine carbamoyltransferase
MKTSHLLSLKDLSRDEIEGLFARARDLKADPRRHAQALVGRTLGLVFQKPSTRTRTAFEVGMAQLGGHAVYLSSDDIQLQRGESVPDTARVLSRFLDGVAARVHAHQDLLDLAKHSTVPVINALSDLLHPLQPLADYFTLHERRGRLEGLKVAYIGDGNNVCHELLFGAAKLGLAMTVASPKGYEPNPLIVKSAAREAQKTKGALPVVTSDARAAAAGADVIYTDVWVSMGQESERAARVQALRGYQVTAELMAVAHPQCLFMHCLPAHRGEEVAAEVIDGPQSVVFDQAENRLHTQKALLLQLLGGA